MVRLTGVLSALFSASVFASSDSLDAGALVSVFAVSLDAEGWDGVAHPASSERASRMARNTDNFFIMISSRVLFFI